MLRCGKQYLPVAMETPNTKQFYSIKDPSSKMFDFELFVFGVTPLISLTKAEDQTAHLPVYESTISQRPKRWTTARAEHIGHKSPAWRWGW